MRRLIKAKVCMREEMEEKKRDESKKLRTFVII